MNNILFARLHSHIRILNNSYIPEYIFCKHYWKTSFFIRNKEESMLQQETIKFLFNLKVSRKVTLENSTCIDSDNYII